ncbi:MAG: hypothetical protein ACLFMM_04715 [Methanohalobium sp.]|uniref:hypothetical protein n=1 Tax=Methanohalobium sp. TaxID=2837493 RepID=UPI00397DD5B7
MLIVSKKKSMFIIAVVVIISVFAAFVWSNFNSERQDNSLTLYNLSEVETGKNNAPLATSVATNLVIP